MTAPPHFAKLDQMNKEKAAARRSKVLAAAMMEAADVGFQWITRVEIAARADVAPASVSFAFGSMVALKRAVLAEAIRTENLPIICQGLAEAHPLTETLPLALRKRAVASMLSA